MRVFWAGCAKRPWHAYPASRWATIIICLPTSLPTPSSTLSALTPLALPGHMQLQGVLMVQSIRDLIGNGEGWTQSAPKAPTAPATVCGERPSSWPLTGNTLSGRRKVRSDPRVRRPALRSETRNAVGCDGRENEDERDHKNHGYPDRSFDLDRTVDPVCRHAGHNDGVPCRLCAFANAA